MYLKIIAAIVLIALAFCQEHHHHGYTLQKILHDTLRNVDNHHHLHHSTPLQIAPVHSHTEPNHQNHVRPIQNIHISPYHETNSHPAIHQIHAAPIQEIHSAPFSHSYYGSRDAHAAPHQHFIPSSLHREPAPVHESSLNSDPAPLIKHIPVQQQNFQQQNFQQRPQEESHLEQSHHGQSHQEALHYEDSYVYPKYEYQYKIVDPHTGDKKSQYEQRDGDLVKGEYSLHDTNGSIRTVKYTADDKSGFNADVSHTATHETQPHHEYH